MMTTIETHAPKRRKFAYRINLVGVVGFAVTCFLGNHRRHCSLDHPPSGG